MENNNEILSENSHTTYLKNGTIKLKNMKNKEWRIDRRKSSIKILDVNYNVVASIYSQDNAEENANLICKAVNEYDKLKEQAEKDQETIKSLIKQLKNNIITCLYFKSIQLPSPGAKEIIISQLENNKELLSKIEK